MTRSARVIAALLMGSMMLVACGADEPTPGSNFPTTPDPTTPDPTTPEPTEPSTPATVSLDLDPVTTTTVCGDSVMITGKATPGSDVYAIGGSATSDIRVSHPVTGAFCIDVPLRKNQVNQLEVQARHPELGIATPKPATVTQDNAACGDTTEPDETPTQELVNVAIGAPVKSKESPDQNPAQFVTDDKLDTWSLWGGGDWYNPWASYDGWVMIDLGQINYVEKVEVHWRDVAGVGEQDYGQEYILLYAPADGFGDPAPNTWLEAPNGNVTDGDGGVDEFHFNGESVKFVALFLKKNGHSSYGESFAISEIKVLKKDQSSTPPLGYSGSQTCDAVGSGS